MRFVRDEVGVARLFGDLDSAANEGRQDVLSEVQARQARRTGRLATDYRSDENGIYSGLPYAGAVERGANVGPRRGPHMKGNRVLVTAGGKWVDHVHRRLRGKL